MDARLQGPAEGAGTLILVPEEDDPFEVQAYGDGEIQIRIPLYSYEARKIIEALTPLAFMYLTTQPKEDV